jgi:hypothetical protein
VFQGKWTEKYFSGSAKDVAVCLIINGETLVLKNTILRGTMIKQHFKIAQLIRSVKERQNKPALKVPY